MSNSVAEAKELQDLESFTQTHFVAQDAIHTYTRSKQRMVRTENERTILVHPNEERQPMKLEHNLGGTAFST